MNKIANKFLLTGDKFMPELHPRQPGSTYGLFNKGFKYLKQEMIQSKSIRTN